jgi:hypothetical protein
MAFDKAAYQREYMKRKRESNAPLSNNARSNSADMLDKSTWEWDEHHIYQKCPHGARYCAKCGTVVTPQTFTPEQWSTANRAILAGIERTKKNGSTAAA